MDRDHLLDSLTFLGELLDAHQCPDIRLVVSGGAALMVQGIVSRTTNDVDVFAQRELEGDLVPGFPLPDWFKRHVAEVARVEGLQENWLNSSTSLVFSDLLPLLPAESWSDVREESFGSRLKVTFFGRGALIFLKAYACTSRTEERDRADLLAMSPSQDDLNKAFAWMGDNELATETRIAALQEELKS